ncbi:MAG: hypothetical protein KDA87_10035 [Planctomycetales bacterium]|nr:hypothetical protein [Planctomycetales bacterium]
MKAKISNRFVITVMLALVWTSGLFAQETEVRPPSVVRDVALQKDGVLRGQLVDMQGSPQANEPVVVYIKGKALGRTLTDPQGNFAFGEIKGGLYQLATKGSSGVYRIWQHELAPPAASPALMLVQGEAIRGQCGTDCGGTCDMCCRGQGGGVYNGLIMNTLSNPWVVSGAVAAGVAIPIAELADDDDAS